jgi:hypothetical protein
MPRNNNDSFTRLMELMESVDVRSLAAEEERLAHRLRAIQALMSQMGAAPSWELSSARGGGRGRGAARAAGSARAAGAGKSRTRRQGKRGGGWTAIETALKSMGGSGGSADLKDAWAEYGGKTPRSVALASFVKSGRLKKKGSGRSAVYSIA